MKTHFKKTLAVLLAALMLVSVFAVPASALTYRTGGNSVSSSYKSGKYYSNYTKVTLGNDDRNNLLAVAFSQLGYQEGPSAGSYSGTVASSGNYTEFNYNAGNWLGTYSYAWCASFVSWSLFQSRCTDQASYKYACRWNVGDTSCIWKEYSCSAWVNQLTNYTSYYKKSASRGGSYTPIYGDIIFFKNSNGPCHVGIVVYVSGNKVYTIEGNTSSGTGLEANGGGVYFKSYSLSSSYIHGYARLPYKNTDNVSNIDYSGNNPTTGLYMTNSAKYLYKDAACTTRATYGDGVKVTVPIYTMVEVTEIANSGSALKVTYDGVTGYLANNSDRVVQITTTSSGSSGSTTTTPTGSNGSLVAGKTPTFTGSVSLKGSGLTDGIYSTDVDDGTWLALNDSNNASGTGYAHFDYDLLKKYTITDAKIHVGVKSAYGIGRTYDMQIEVSDDKSTWTSAGTFSVPAGTWADGTYTFSLTGLKASGRYVRIKAVTAGWWYINEIVVNGYEYNGTDDTTSESIVHGKTPTYYGTTSHNAADKVTDGIYSSDTTDGTWLGLGSNNRPSGSEYVYFQFDLGSDYTLTGAKIHIGYNSDWSVAQPWDVNIEVSLDGATWTRAAEFATSNVDWSGTNGAHTFSLESIGAVARYVRVKAINSPWFFVNEFELYGEAYTGETQTNLLKGKTPTYTGTTTYTGSGITDGKYSTDTTDGTWLGLTDGNRETNSAYVSFDFDLGERYAIEEATIYFGYVGGDSGIGRPYDLMVQVSDDKSTWTTIGSFDLPSDLTKGYHTYTVGNMVGAGRYIRFTAVNAGWFFINEVLAYGEVAVEEEPIVTPDPGTTTTPADKGLRGDVDADGEITASDYLYLKRIYFGTLKMSALEDPDNAKYRCDVEVNDLIEAMDYILLKRAYFGTYKIVQD